MVGFFNSIGLLKQTESLEEKLKKIEKNGKIRFH